MDIPPGDKLGPAVCPETSRMNHDLNWDCSTFSLFAFYGRAIDIQTEKTKRAAESTRALSKSRGNDVSHVFKESKFESRELPETVGEGRGRT
jgi:hypothetical protein